VYLYNHIHFSIIGLLIINLGSGDSAVSIATGWLSGFRFPAGARGYSLLRVCTPALGTTLSAIRRVPGNLSLGLQQPEHEGDHSPPVPRSRIVELYFHSPVRINEAALS
jgi:hypothetical protein